jgi:flagellar hook-basal body complex protein FliE
MKIGSSTPLSVQQNQLLVDRTATQGAKQLEKSSDSFVSRLEDGLKQVANTQNEASALAANYELGAEQDLAKVMVSQQVSSVAFQLTLNVRNKALSAYKDIMNMPV